MQKILLIDAMSLAFRAYYSMPPTMTLKDGTPINAVYGFTSLVFQAIAKLKPTHVCVCFDVKSPTFRHELYSEYKGHRPPAPEDFVVQIPHLRSILDKCGIHRIEKAGFEADDLMGTLSEIADDAKMASIVLTSDGDCLQLVSEHTRVVMNKKGMSELAIFDNDAVEEKYGITAKQIIDYKALKGDSSDNIPGVLGIGDKTAVKLLQEFKTLDGIYENIESISSKSVQKKLLENKENAYLSYTLATIKIDIPLDIALSQYEFNHIWAKIMPVFEEYQFTSLLRRYNGQLNGVEVESDSETALKKPDGIYHCIQTEAAIKELLPSLQHGFAIDLETTSLSIRDAQIVGIALAVTEKEAYYIPLNDYVSSEEKQTSLFETTTENPFQISPLLTTLKPILENPKIDKYTHNGKYEYAVLQNYGVTLKGITFDTLLAAYLLNPGNRLGLKEVVETYYGIGMTQFETVVGKGKAQVTFDMIDLKAATEYAAADADFTLRLKNTLSKEIQDKELQTLLDTVELPSMLALAKMERHGVKLDQTYLKELETEFDTEISLLKTEIFEMAGEEFNLNSTQQLAVILFDKLALPVQKKTKTGRSTDSSVLEKLAHNYPIAKQISEYRVLEKLQNTYVRTLPKLVNPKTNRIHTSFNQTVAATGRLSSNNPNLQNIPIRSDAGRKIRKAFIPSSNQHELLSVDYSQIELRILAHLAQDPNMIAAFKNGQDIHAATAGLVFNIPVEEVTKDQRYRAKAVNFGIIYGQSVFGLSETLGISRAEAKEIIDTYYQQFPTITAFMQETIDDAKETESVKTEFGRIRPVPEINSKNFQRRSFSERMAINTRMQGTAADIMKIAMINIQEQLEEGQYKSKMILQVHDELVFDVPIDEKNRLLELVTTEMQAAAELSVPLSVDAAFGSNWADIS